MMYLVWESLPGATPPNKIAAGISWTNKPLHHDKVVAHRFFKLCFCQVTVDCNMGEGLTLISVEKLKRQIDKKGS